MSPAAEQATFKVLDGFEVNLFASEADGVPNPLVIRWDERGRLWVVCPLSYPQPVPGELLRDKIVILEDTDHDGKADKFTTFADGLLMPTGLELAPAKSPKGHSVYVGMGEKLLLMHDLDGDDKVDETETVLSGFGTGDTHQNINSFIWSPDGALVMHQGLHCYSRVVTAWGVKELYGAGFWHYRPLSGKLEPYPTGMPLNAWGTAFTNDGQPIMVAGAAGMFWARPMEISTSGTDSHTVNEKLTAGTRPFLLERHQLPYGGQILKTEGLRKFCGIDIVGSTHWPKSMQGELVTGGFFENAVFRYTLTDDKEFPSGPVATEQPPLITSSSVAFRPVDIRFGPEGALYIADWYDPIIGHYQASFRHPNRDKAHGRIWRVVAKGREMASSKPIDIAKLAASVHDQILSRTKPVGRTQRLVDVGHTELMPTNLDRWASYQGFRLLRSNSNAVATAANNLMPPDDGVSRAKPEFDQVRLMALNLQATAEQIDFGDLLYAYDRGLDLEASRVGVITALGRGAEYIFRTDVPFELLSRAATDDSPRVRLEAVVAAAKVQSPDAIKVALKVLDKPMDSYIERALWLAVHATKKHWFPFAHVGVEPLGDRSDGSSLRQPSSASDSDSPSPNQASKSPEGSTPTDPAKAFRTFVKDVPAPHIAFLVKHEGSKELRELCATMLTQNDLPANVRDGLTLALAKDNATELTAADAKRLKDAGNDHAKLTALWREREKQRQLADAALIKLAKIAPDEAVQQIMVALPVLKSTDAVQSLLAPVLPLEAANKALVAALKAKPCSADTAKLIMRVLTSTGRSEPDLMGVLTGILGASSPVPAYSAEFVNTLAAEVKSSGHADKGKAVFNSTIVNCTACHSIAKKGGTIGPELDAVGRGVPIELLIEAVVWPNRQIKEGYIATLIKTKNGRTLQGYKVSDANGELQLRDLLSKTVTKFAASEIETRTDSGSLMPEGLVALMTREELRDLIAYLASLGR